MKQTVSRTWITPAGNTWNLCNDILQQTHVVIGGTTGAGKSTLLHSIMWSALIDSPARVQFVLIDLKGVELRRYRNLPHTIAYADEPDDAVRAVNMTVDILRNRMDELKQTNSVMYEGHEIYLIIDELAVLMQTAKAKVLEPLSNIMRLGRAARIHVIGATQNPSRSSGGGLPAQLIGNMTAGVALACRSAIESRQTIGVSGAEKLPLTGSVRYGMYWNTGGISTEVMPLTSENELNERINYWMQQKPIITKERRGFFKWLSN